MTTAGTTIRPFRETDVDFVISRQLALYESEYGFTSGTWKEYLTGGVRSLVNRFDPGLDCLFILEAGGIPAGCIAIAHADRAAAQLRFFFLEPDQRGQGAGRRLFDRAIGFCREKNYSRVFLWTFSTLAAARHLYETGGFRITETRMNTDWGEPVLEER